MKRLILCIAVCHVLFNSQAQDKSWQMVSGKISSPWSSQVDPANVLNAYPRPQLQRSSWTNLNGLWQYAILPKSQGANMPSDFQGNILVPFAVESALSGVGKTVGEDSVLWYRTTINVDKKRNNKKILLHFGAVDWQSDIYVNDNKVGSHQGGYDPFSFDITDYLVKGTAQQLAVKVWDPSDEGPQPRGKQVKHPHVIWYTPVTGIWQTVWMETVPTSYIASTIQTPDLDNKALSVTTMVENAQDADQLLITAWKGKEKVAEQTTTANKEIKLSITNPELWSPETPFLYDLRVSLLRKGKVVDEVKSYFAMRKISMGKDANNIQRMLLNNEFVFQFGPLDQGWWPDGLYTAPTDDALKFDIIKTKEMGFNMIRKHVKVEPARWYYYCDQLGILVWQDMPSGDLGNRWENRPGVFGRATDKDRTPESESYYRTEWKEIMQDLHNFPSIVVWVPFNEAWGQFKTTEIVNWTMQKDPSRLVNTASGGNFVDVGHIMDLHNYPEPLMPDPDLFGAGRILVLGEYGGLGLPVENHTWQDKNNWGYQSFKNKEELFKRYEEYINRLPFYIEKGLSAAVYTQTTDVEIETNGLMTYDRKVIKYPVDKLNELHKKLYNPALAKMVKR